MRTTVILAAMMLVWSQLEAQTSPHGTIRVACAVCHTTDSWKMRSDASFDHATTGFSLSGAHKAVECAACHVGFKFAGTKNACSSCHTDIHKGELGTNCTRCHTSSAWLVPDMRQRHQQTRFPLVGQHASADCKACHAVSTGIRYAGIATTCVGCHQKDFASSKNPDHRAAGFSTDCTLCHKVNDAAWGKGFNHAKATFPLAGAHLTAACNACHTKTPLSSASTACYDCHSKSYTAAVNPNHASANFGKECQTCHTPVAWKLSSYSHDVTAFPLTGAHRNATCAQCHTGGSYAGTGKQCIDCHRTDYTNSANPAHVAGAFSATCTDCHGTTGWSPAKFDHAGTAFVLTGKHATADCADCHTNGNFTLKYTDCFPCHQTVFSKTTNPNHAAGGFSHACSPCHTTTGWTPSTFSHESTRFPLKGAHLSVKCSSCHVNNKFTGLPSACVDCHRGDYTNSTNPNHVAGGFSTDCTTCHSLNNWSPASFDHSATTFALTGTHKTVACQSCHVSANYQIKYTNCYQCHQTDFQRPTSPNHVAGTFSHDCVPCHTTTRWNPSTFTHSLTKFPLQGAHLSVTCSACHINNKFSDLPSTCVDCHRTQYANTTNPNHVSGAFSTDCAACHSLNGWSPASFDHATTAFSLNGAHTTASCQSCHVNGNFQIRYTDCYQCHQTDFQRPTSPNHVAGSFSHACAPCHTTTTWTPSTFNHASTNFPLSGAHQSVACASCHVNNKFAGLPSQCVDCHRSDYAATTNPNHVARGFSTTCSTCHSMTSWSSTTFDHATTAFPLTGVHTTTACQSCHVSDNYQLSYTNCYPCHQTDFQRPTSPNHVAGGFSHACAPCHTTTVWKPSTFTHASTNFPLSSAHQSVACADCHVNNKFAGLPSQCIDCHRADYTNTTNPNHAAGSFSTNCTTCHAANSWSAASFDHAGTRFPLTGKHASASCVSCHTNGNYQLVYADCYQCHQTDFQRPTSPNHVAGTFSHACAPCHTTTSWSPSTFSHGSTNFSLTGAHQSVACASCHINNKFAGLPSQCVDCHRADYTNTLNPNHVARGFSTACSTCHSTNGWTGASFDHTTTTFALTGAHAIATCQSCHINGNYQLSYTDCYQCHQTDFQRPTNPNHVLGNFSHTCSTCHTTTVWKPSTFSHASTSFPLRGAHLSVSCASCHVNNKFAGLPSQCVDCHRTDYSNTTNPNHVAGSFPTSCSSCHSENGWSPASFDHAATRFALTGKHIAASCQACHTNGNYQLVYTDCFQCHQTDFQRPTNPNHAAGLFSHTCATCHTTTTWTPSTFSHASTNFPLSGAHLSVTCSACHVNNKFAGLPSQCIDCHRTDYTNATNPNHVTGSISTTCTSCHSMNGWSPASFDHASTRFALTGKHTSASCQACHTNGNYQLVYTDCYPCHQTAFQQPTSPNHVAGSFAHDCVPCHTTTSWSPSTFAHSSTSFPLTGAHLSVSCSSCHVNNKFSGLSHACIDCHRTDFNNTTNPNHVAGSFSTTCTTCHTMNSWSPASFNHATTLFPLTGAHTAASCQSCHTNGNYQLAYTDCYQCHQTDFQRPTNPNHTTQSFPHACAPCHSTTVWKPLTYNHDTQYFKINSGAHRGKWTLCTDCHKSPGVFSSFTCTTCHGKSSTNQDHSGVSGYVYASANCYSCHRTI